MRIYIILGITLIFSPLLALLAQPSHAATHSVVKASRMYFTTGGSSGFGRPSTPGKIERANLDCSDQVELILTGPIVNNPDDPDSRPAGLALDFDTGLLFWTDFLGGLFSANLDGSDPKKLAGTPGEEFANQGVDVDEMTRRVFWLNDTDEVPHIRSINEDGTGQQTVLDDVVESFPSDLVIDPIGGKMYWADGDMIMVANLDGSGIQTLIDSLEPPPRGLALDVRGGKIYFTAADEANAQVQRANLDGTNVELLVFLGEGLEFFSWGIGLDLAAGHIYWADDRAGKIQRSNFDGSNVVDICTGLDKPHGLALEPVIQSKIPTLSEWGLIAMAGVLGIIGLLAIRRKKAVT